MQHVRARIYRNETDREDARNEPRRPGLGRKRRILPWTASHPGYATLKFRRLVVVSLAEFHPPYEHDRPIFSHPPSFPLFSFLSSLFDRGYPRDQQPLIDTPIEDADPFVIPLLFYSRWRIIYAAIRLQDSSTGFDRFLSIGFAFAIDRFPWIGKLAYDRQTCS